MFDGFTVERLTGAARLCILIHMPETTNATGATESTDWDKIQAVGSIVQVGQSVWTVDSQSGKTEDIYVLSHDFDPYMRGHWLTLDTLNRVFIPSEHIRGIRVLTAIEHAEPF